MSSEILVYLRAIVHLSHCWKVVLIFTCFLRFYVFDRLPVLWQHRCWHLRCQALLHDTRCLFMFICLCFTNFVSGIHKMFIVVTVKKLFDFNRIFKQNFHSFINCRWLTDAWWSVCVIKCLVIKCSVIKCHQIIATNDSVVWSLSLSRTLLNGSTFVHVMASFGYWWCSGVNRKY